MEALGLVADIGRISVRFGLADLASEREPFDVRHYRTADYPTFTDALLAYLNDSGIRSRKLPSVLAIAGAAHGDVVRMTGNRWYLTLGGIEAVLGAQARALNECAANAMALPALPREAFSALPGPAPGLVRPGGNYLVIGPGTGLGVAGLITVGGRLCPIQSEAAHMAFAASTTDEARVAAHIVRQGRSACTEGVVSAAGLSTIYAAISGETGASRPPEEITRDARSDPLAGQTLSTFVGALGSVIGDLVLAFTAWDGVFITGALARAICPALAGPELRRRMENKSTFGRKLATVPLAVVTRNDLELAGAAVALRSNWQHATP